MPRTFICDTCFYITGIYRDGKCPFCIEGTSHICDVFPSNITEFQKMLREVKAVHNDQDSVAHYFYKMTNNEFLLLHKKNLSKVFGFTINDTTEKFKLDLTLLSKPVVDELDKEIKSLVAEIDFNEFAKTIYVIKHINNLINEKVNSFDTWETLRSKNQIGFENHIVLCNCCSKFYPYLGYSFCAFCGNENIEEFNRELSVRFYENNKTAIWEYIYPLTQTSSASTYLKRLNYFENNFADLNILGNTKLQKFEDDLKSQFLMLTERKITFSEYVIFLATLKAKIIHDLTTAYRDLEETIVELVFSFLKISNLEHVEQKVRKDEIEKVKDTFKGAFSTKMASETELKFLETCFSQAVDNFLNRKKEKVNLYGFLENTKQFHDNHVLKCAINPREYEKAFGEKVIHVSLSQVGWKFMSDLAKVTAIAYAIIKWINPGIGAFVALTDLVKKIYENTNHIKEQTGEKCLYLNLLKYKSEKGEYPPINEFYSYFNTECICCKECRHHKQEKDKDNTIVCSITTKQIDATISYLKSKNVLVMSGPEQIALNY